MKMYSLSEVIRVIYANAKIYLHFLPQIFLTHMTGTYGKMGTLICDDAKY